MYLIDVLNFVVPEKMREIF